MSVLIRRGPAASIPTLAVGELGLATDTGQVYVGTDGGNELVGGSVADGDYGDIVVSSSGTVWSFDSAVVTTAARTVLDDTTVADMVNTLGGASSTGTGGLVRTTSPTLVTPLLGTPTSGTLTNCTGLPIAGLTASTSTALGVGSVELGHASDTTISRGASGFIAVEGNRVPSPASQAQGDLLYRDTTEWARLAKDTNASRYLSNTGSSNNPAWAQIDLTNGVTGLLPPGNGGTPVGTIIAFGEGSTLPTGYLECDGSSVSQSTYAALYALLGTTWGVAGGGNFTLPDFRRRVPMGRGGSKVATAAPNTSVGNIGGSEQNTLTSAEMPVHTHTQNSHSHATAARTNATGFGGSGDFGLTNAGGTSTPTLSTSSTTATNQNAGSGGAHDNVQPSAVVKFCIKF